MKLSSKSNDYLVPEYSLTGDLLSFLTCNLQYRYQNKGSLPPSTPIQLWFGEFIHGIMEEAFLKWDSLDEEEKSNFPWDWLEEIRPIEEMIDKRLQSRGLYPPTNFYCYNSHPTEKAYSCPDNLHPHKLLYSARAEAAINTWGPHLFPLIKDTELLIKSLRDMPENENRDNRSSYYSINGVVDVLSSIKLEDFKNNTNNKIFEYLKNNKEFLDKLNDLENSDKFEILETDEFEIIIDYKGMKRPSLDNKNWMYHEWQILTYAWLRSMKEDSKPVIGGIIFYLNELVPSTQDLIAIQKDYQFNKNNDFNTDVDISDKDFNIIFNWNSEEDKPIHRDLSDKFKRDRSIRIIAIDDNLIESSLKEFDNVVDKIESSTLKEINGFSIKDSWKSNGEDRNCGACDFKNFCNKNEDLIKDIKIP